jgi:hormone-sensitive lipase
VIHVHGGGFVAMSSRAHQNYLRKWAKMLPNSVIMSLDYRLAPAFTHPAALDDVWQGYYWVLTQARIQLGTERVS